MAHEGDYIYCVMHLKGRGEMTMELVNIPIGPGRVSIMRKMEIIHRKWEIKMENYTSVTAMRKRSKHTCKETTKTTSGAEITVMNER